MSASDPSDYHFRISLSVLEHLGRNLYRSFITILGEAISNSWDADANTVNIVIDRDKGTLLVWDDGDGMSDTDFKEKFLNVGYSKREEFGLRSGKDRPFLGAKGIGKLALLSCSKKVTVISKAQDKDFVGGVIDNEALDEAMQADKETGEYLLGAFDLGSFPAEIIAMEKGTAIFFDGLNDTIRNRIPYIRQQIAKYFRFFHVDKSFQIIVNGTEISPKDLEATYQRTEFLWKINDWEDEVYPEFSLLQERFTDNLEVKMSVGGYIASVKKPRDLSITGLDERMGIDLFVNGRLRQRDILSLIPTARLAESYLHGQIFFDELDGDGEDRFTSSREGVKEDDSLFRELLEKIREHVILKIVSQWDKWRLESGQDGDDDEPRKTPSQRKAISLMNIELEDYSESIKGNKKLKNWIKCFTNQAEFNIPSFVQMFVSENLVRKYIKDQGLVMKSAQKNVAQNWRERHQKAMGKASVSYPIREDGDLSYLGMDDLAYIVDGGASTAAANLSNHAEQYKPGRNTIAHTAFLNDDGKLLLEASHKNIVHRINNLLKGVK